MWIDRLTSSRTLHAVELAAQFAEQRQRVLAENMANIDTPDYHSQRLDPAAFQTSLRDALSRANQTGQTGLELRGNAQFSTDAAGRATARPVTEPAPNVLFQDGTNGRLEQLVASANSNALSYELATELLRNRLDNLMQAIRGRAT